MKVKDQDQCIIEAGRLIRENNLHTLDELFHVVTRQKIAQLLNLNPIRFSNSKSNMPQIFKISDIIILSKNLAVTPQAIFQILLNSALADIQTADH